MPCNIPAVSAVALQNLKATKYSNLNVHYNHIFKSRIMVTELMPILSLNPSENGLNSSKMLLLKLSLDEGWIERNVMAIECHINCNLAHYICRYSFLQWIITCK